MEAPQSPQKANETLVDGQPGMAASRRELWISAVAWIVALVCVGVAVQLWQMQLVVPPIQDEAAPTTAPTATEAPAAVQVDVPGYERFRMVQGVARIANVHTIIPTRPRAEIIEYAVDFGDSIFGIAEKFNIEPETVLWANYDLLQDNPDFLEPGMELHIPPLDGVYYQWEEGDTLESVATEFEASVDEIINFIGNAIDLANPNLETGQMVMLPGAHREFRQWLIPTIPRGSAGVNTTALGPGACLGSYEGAYGSGAFVWPTSNHFISGNDYWSGHLGLDLAAVQGDALFAADAGVVVFSGWANGGYGYMVMVDHGNGYQTLYAHMSQVSVPCGASVSAGRLIGLAGSTGNSTGAHLHFEVRYDGGFINPWFILPPP